MPHANFLAQWSKNCEGTKKCVKHWLRRKRSQFDQTMRVQAYWLISLSSRRLGAFCPLSFARDKRLLVVWTRNTLPPHKESRFCLSVPFSFKCNTVAQDSNHFVSRLIILLSLRKNICYSLIRPLVTVSVMETPCDFYIYIFQIQTRMPCTDLRQLSTSFN